MLLGYTDHPSIFKSKTPWGYNSVCKYDRTPDVGVASTAHMSRITSSSDGTLGALNEWG